MMMYSEELMDEFTMSSSHEMMLYFVNVHWDCPDLKMIAYLWGSVNMCVLLLAFSYSKMCYHAKKRSD